MRNYVIINGVNSNTINGLGINELPPITKPLMRSLAEEIDGRDGDITTNLGYSAYDKTITIGLFGTGYDINNIVAFFNGEGTIVFSNEPDKYYNFKILNQIDYVALQKFKSASITFHCQPFKYPLTETPLEIEYEYIEDEGESLTLNNTGEATLKLDLLGNTSQTGTPTPSTPISVNTCSGDNEVEIVGTNILNPSKFTSSTTQHIISIDEITSVIDITTNTYNSFGMLFDNLNLPSGTYTMYCEVLSGTFTGGNLCFFSTSNSQYGFEFNFKTSTTHIYTNTFSNGLNQIKIWQPQCSSDVKLKIWLVKGSTIGEYEPYQSQTYEVDLGDIELCKIGDYQDYFTKNSTGQWCKYNAIGKYTMPLLSNVVGIYDNSSSETQASKNGTFAIFTGTISNNISNNTMAYTIASYEYKSTINGNSTAQNNLSDNSFCMRQGTNDRIYFRCSSFTGKTGNQIAQEIQGTTLYYVLATPTITEITDTTLISQLDNIQNAMSYEGQTNISQVNNDKAFIISAKAVKEGTNEVVVNNIGNTYSKPLIALEGSGNVDIYLDNTQILKANVEDKMNIDIAKLEAYNPDTSALLNRQVIGNYNTMTLQPGNNTIKIDGALDKATISNYTRWL